jgi:sugar phosphate isomerase/epimerase
LPCKINTSPNPGFPYRDFNVQRVVMKNPFAVSTWSVHRKLGYSFANGPGAASPFVKSDTWGTGECDLLRLPAELAARGYFRCEICHFHIGTLEPAALVEIRLAFEASGVVIQTLLVDDGDITNPVTRARDLEWMTQWIEAASHLGSEHVRVIAGKALPSPEALQRSVEGLQQLVAVGLKFDVPVVTENWFDLLSTPQAVHHVLDHVPGLGFMADTGNWTGASKYQDLRSIFARASLCHAKACLAPGLALDEADFADCLAAARAAHYSGPLTLIFADAGDEWQGLEVERQFIQRQPASFERA